MPPEDDDNPMEALQPLPDRPIPRRHGPRKWRNMYDGVLDLMIAEPGMSQRELAARLGKTHAWICSVVNTDMFKARLHERRLEHQTILSETISEQIVDIAHTGMRVLKKKLSEDGIDANTALSITQDALSRAGYVPETRSKREINLNINDNPVQRAWLARQKMLAEEGEFKPIGAKNEEPDIPSRGRSLDEGEGEGSLVGTILDEGVGEG